MPDKYKLLVFRFSAMGDVAMMVPVLQQFIAQNPHVELIIVSRTAFKPLFNQVDYHAFHPIEPNKKHKGLIGLFRLFNELKCYQIDGVADLHQNIRSQILTGLFKLTGVKTRTIHKGRAEKKCLTRRKNKDLTPVKSSTDRYADVLRSIGFTLVLKPQLIKSPQPLSQQILAVSGSKNQLSWIGVSPFAQHPQKVYPLDKMYHVITHLAKCGYHIFIFGGGTDEKNLAENWEIKHHLITSVIGKLSLAEELDLISNLDVMISMDSSGMHLASIKGVPTVSIWGATHPYTGFVGFGQTLENCVLLNLYCQPCSVYGNKPCYRKDFACMNNLPEEDIIEKVKLVLAESRPNT
jgi:ADP-heptose:LPS heptosyltransferase